MKPWPSLYHGIQPQWSWMSQSEPEGTVRCLSSHKQAHLNLAKNSRPLPRQNVYSHIEMIRNLQSSQGEDFALGPHKDLVCQLVKGARKQTSLVVDIKDTTTIVLSVRTNTWWSLRSGRKCFSAQNTASISKQLMCHMRWWPLHRPRAGWPLMTTPQPVRHASVASITRRQGAPSTGPWDKNQGFLHISKACRHHRVTLSMRNGFPLGENPLVLSHHCGGLMYSWPKDITLDRLPTEAKQGWARSVPGWETSGEN